MRTTLWVKGIRATSFVSVRSQRSLHDGLTWVSICVKNLLVGCTLPKLLLLRITYIKRLGNKIVSVSSALPRGLQGHWLHRTSGCLLLWLLLLITSRRRCTLTYYFLQTTVVALCSWVILTLVVRMHFHNISLTGILSFKLLLWMILLVHLLLILRLWARSSRFFCWCSVIILSTLASRLGIELSLLLNFWVLNEPLWSTLWGTCWSISSGCRWLKVQGLRHLVWGKTAATRCVGTLTSIVGCTILRSWAVALSCISLMVARGCNELLRWSTLSRADYERWIDKITMELIVLASLGRPCGVRILCCLWFHILWSVYNYWILK